MKKIVKLSLAVAMMSGLGAVNAQAADNGFNILSDVKVKGQIRTRIETADTGTAGVDAASAITARTKLTVTGGLFEVEGLTSSIGIISVNNFGYNNHNSVSGHSTAAGNAAYDKIVDPQDAMLSEASIDYSTGKTSVHVGRSNINLDNQRFIGTVGWRQLERSYDTVYVANSSVENLSVLAAYVYGFAGVAGVTTTDTNSILLNAAYNVMPELKVTGYAYLLGSIHDTYGIALTGKVNTAAAKLAYRAEFAIQSDATMETYGVASKADASYVNLDLGTNISSIILGINYEALSGSDGTGTATAFSTPLGTNHKFNGWADQFLGTPTQGLTDLNVRIGYKAKGFGKVLVKYHMFTSDVDATTSTGAATTDLGSELDVVYVNKIPGVKNLKGLVKYASFAAGDSTVKTKDVSKMWLMLDYKF